MPLQDDDELLPEKDGAAYIHRHEQTVRRQRRDGTLPFGYLKIGGRYFYRKSVLEAYLRECEVAAGGCVMEITALQGKTAARIAGTLEDYRRAHGKDPENGSYLLFKSDWDALQAAAAKARKRSGATERRQLLDDALTFRGVPLKPYTE